ncbi:hypothetical protein GE061_008543 [Apolygus lucorum]|uniref:Uncharacterized protein n=1 Tax=Apolygus lucorum TaxID=248454 RepID=A0A8S9WMT6_APOLU|nr:hypothetical protein GE061_008543 [Apolygus lucorum]
MSRDSTVSKRSPSPYSEMPDPKRFHALEQRTEKMEKILEQILMATKVDEEKGFQSGEEDGDPLDDFGEYGGEAASPTHSEQSWLAPSLLRCGPGESFSFMPEVKEQEPPVPEPDVELNQLGISCQRLGSSSWNKVRYVEAQKLLQVGGVFSKLAVNASLPSAPGFVPSLLSGFDSTLGTITHGLLCQRSAFSTAVNDIIKKHPAVASDLISALAAPEANFKKFSDNVLQFVCEKRAETLEARRKLYEPADRRLAQLLQEVPLSESICTMRYPFRSWFEATLRS